MPTLRLFLATSLSFIVLSTGFLRATHAQDPLPTGDDVIESILAHQRKSGGWPKNYKRNVQLSESARAQLAADFEKSDSTIDNGASYTEIRLLATANRNAPEPRLQKAVLRGVDFLLKAQYENGGWPQYFPDSRGYARHITFNDNAMIGVMRLLQQISDDTISDDTISDDTISDDDGPDFLFIEPSIRDQCRLAVERGIECILACQIQTDGERTVWCAQHDEVTFAPRKARSYELPSFSGSESVGIVRFLMQVDEPSAEVIEAIEGAVKWLESNRIDGIRLERIDAPDQPGGRDRVLVRDAAAPPMWARFYDLQTSQPIFCSRDGIPKMHLADISHERRNGYSWLGYYARDLLSKDLPTWRKRIAGS